MAELSPDGTRRRWHEALTFAVTGQRRDVGEQSRPDIAELSQNLLAEPGRPSLNNHLLSTRAAGRPWPHEVPADLMLGLGYAQFAAALSQLRSALALDEPGRPPRVGRTQATTPADRRLLDEVPPHHGS